MKISYVMIGTMFVIFLMFALYGIITFETSLQEMKKLLSARNEAFAFNMMQDIDQRLENRIINLNELTQIPELQEAVIESNLEFEQIQDIKNYLNIKEQEIEFAEQFPTPFLLENLDQDLSENLQEKIEFYREEYNFDVFEELFVTNKYGANIAMGIGYSDYVQEDEEWWQKTKENGIFFDSVQFNLQYGASVVPIGFRIGDSTNFLGVMRAVISLNDILEDFDDEAELINNLHRNVILLDQNGKIIYSNGIVDFSNQEPVLYYDSIMEGKDVGRLELEDTVDDIKLISYAKSTGYKSFEGFDWTVVIEQDSSLFVEEFVEMRDTIITVSFIGMVFSIILGIAVTKLVTNPLKDLAHAAKSISKGDFDVKLKKTRITEFQEIQKSFKKMSSSLEKLIETEKNLAEAQAKVKDERLRAMGELAASMAHDIKNPLGTIKTSSDIIRRSTNRQDSELDDVIKRMDRAISRISHQVEDVLNFVRTTPINISKTSLVSLLESSINSLDVPSNITIELPQKSLDIKCDSKKMEIVFINILLNALQAIGDKEGKIKIRIKDRSDTIEIEFEDTGKGIPENLISKIFDPLVTTKEKGTGLGLSSCKNIIEQHGGKISVKNKPTTFVITLPKNE